MLKRISIGAAARGARCAAASVALLVMASIAVPCSASAQQTLMTPDTVRELPDNGGAIGVLYTDDAVSNGAQAAYVASVDEVLPAQAGGILKAGDMILRMDSKVATSPTLFARYVRSLRPGASVQLDVMRADTHREERVVVPIIDHSAVAIPGISAPPSTGETFTRSCASGAVAGVIGAGLTLLIAPFDGGFTFSVFAPKAIAGAIIGCAAVGTGAALAQEVVPSGSVIAYRRVL